MRKGQIGMILIFLLLIVAMVVIRIYFDLQSEEMEIQRMNIHSLIQTLQQ
ncbi:hypothetical protein [Athalassotoga saccharophila]|nr:hypothetical protein [Athalassotoga saccharophila]BBJ28901.1 hypothetical protein ATHSA_1823 [Athalassotoga saccharophila]